MARNVPPDEAHDFLRFYEAVRPRKRWQLLGDVWAIVVVVVAVVLNVYLFAWLGGVIGWLNLGGAALSAFAVRSRLQLLAERRTAWRLLEDMARQARGTL